MTYEYHECQTCSTEFQGNFCPRCGQSAKIVRKISLWKTFLLFIDVWGLGNRGMFRTIRDLFLRPGYMICDYIRGMHQAYFPPFKLLFLLTTLSLLIGHGWNLQGRDYYNTTAGQHEASVVETSEKNTSEEITSKDNENLEKDSYSQDENKMIASIISSLQSIGKFQIEYPALFQIAFMLVATIFYFFFFRKSKIIGKFSLQEFFIAMIYISDMVSLYNCIFRFFGFNHIFIILSGLTYLIPLKQMTGYSWWKTIGCYALTWLIILLTLALAIILVSVFITTLLYLRHPEL